MNAPTRSALALAAAIGCLGASVAGAADLGPYRPRGAPAPAMSTWEPSRIERWTGFYLGATYGYGWGASGVEGASGVFNYDQSGGIGTLHGGYNWQSGSGVFGLEADIGLASHGGSAQIGGSKLTSDINALGSVRARAGLLTMPALLVYATGGFAWADMDIKVNGVRASETFTGYQLGAGAEYMIAPQWTLRVEYLYTDLDKERLNHGGVVNTYDPDLHTVRAGISFKF